MVYMGGPFFNLAEQLYFFGWLGLSPAVNAGSTGEVLCNLDSQALQYLHEVSEAEGIPSLGILGECAKRGLHTYCAARDGFDGGTITEDEINAALIAEGRADLAARFGEFVYSLDIFGLLSVTNAAVANLDGIQADAGTLAEVGIAGMGGRPITLYNSQITADFGPLNWNPMALGAASPDVFAAISPSIASALDTLEQKIENVRTAQPGYVGSADYSHCVPPPPLQIYWSLLGWEVWRTKYNDKNLFINGDGTQDRQRSMTPFAYHALVANKTNASITAWIALCAERVDAFKSTFPASYLQEVWVGAALQAPPYRRPRARPARAAPNGDALNWAVEAHSRPQAAACIPKAAAERPLRTRRAGAISNHAKGAASTSGAATAGTRSDMHIETSSGTPPRWRPIASRIRRSQPHPERRNAAG